MRRLPCRYGRLPRLAMWIVLLSGLFTGTVLFAQPDGEAPETTTAAGSSPATSGVPSASSPATHPSRILVLRVEGGLFSGTADYIVQAVHKAETEGLPVLITLDTPGGALDATRDIVKAFLGAKVPILVWVGPAGARAGSAGVFLTMAANVAGMAPGTNIGAAHPIGMGVGAPADDEEEATPGGNSTEKRDRRDEQEVMAQKIENDTLAFIESIATARKRNVEWALAAVKDSVSVTAEKALELKVIDLLARDVDAMLAASHGRVVETAAGAITLHTEGIQKIELPMSLRQRFMAFLSDPNLVYILFVIGMLGLYLEMSHPGAIMPAVVGGVSLLLALTGLSILPYNATGLIFLVIAGVCFVAEAYVTSFGLLALGGAAALVIGGILLFDTPPDLEGVPAFSFGVAPTVLATVAVLSLACVLPVAYLVARAHSRKPVSGQEGLIGLAGKALTAVGPTSGRVFVHGEYWEARSQEPIEAGQEVTVTGMQGLTLMVAPKRSV